MLYNEWDSISYFTSYQIVHPVCADKLILTIMTHISDFKQET